jgi:hypothetical protein
VIALILAAAVAVAGPSTNVIVVRDYAAVANCRALGEVRGVSRLGGVLANTAYNHALDQLKRNAAALGGSHVQIVDSASGFTGSRMIGTAFACPTP